MESRIRKITEHGQAIWLDFISREFLETGGLRELVEEGVRGVTSNPTIFQKAIAEGSVYDDQIRELARKGMGVDDVYEALAVQDIRNACDVLRPVFDQTKGADGFVSIEVSPKLAHDTDATIAEARRLNASVKRPNVMIKVPATVEGVPAIRTLIGEGINVNVTLIFAPTRYDQVMQAYLEGLGLLRDAGKPLDRVSSVASFFVSRVDSLVDKLLEERIAAGSVELRGLLGRAAIANAKIAYKHYQNIFESEPFKPFREKGARVQRPLWASTSTKNPNYPDTIYVDNLIGPNTVNTVPPATLDSIRERAVIDRTIDKNVDTAFRVIEQLQAAGIDFSEVTDELLVQGVQLFADSFTKLIGDLDAKRQRFAEGAAAAR